MALALKEIDIFLFDFHLDLRPLLSPARMTKDFEFLSDPAKYHGQQSTARPFTAGKLEIHPLGVRSRKRNRFWSRYNPGFSKSATPDWDIQIPFTIHPGLTIGLNVTPATAKVRSTIQISAIGWSTQLEISIKGSLGFDDLQALTQRLLDKNQKPFQVANDSKSLPGLFSHFGGLWQKAAFKDPLVPPRDTNPIPRHIVISIGNYDGQAKPFRHQLGSTNWMTDAECAQLHGVLLGRSFSIQELSPVAKDQGYTYIQFGDSSNFAISYFGHGSLIFMQEEAASARKRRESMRCLGRNISHFSQLALSIPNILSTAESGQSLQALQGTLKSSLKSLGQNYTNEFCKMWFGKHKLLQEL